MMGLMLPLCIKDILEGKIHVDEVKGILVSENLLTEEKLWKEMMILYKDFYWNGDKEGEQIAQVLRQKGKLVSWGIDLDETVVTSYWIEGSILPPRAIA